MGRVLFARVNYCGGLSGVAKRRRTHWGWLATNANLAPEGPFYHGWGPTETNVACLPPGVVWFCGPFLCFPYSGPWWRGSPSVSPPGVFIVGPVPPQETNLGGRLDTGVVVGGAPPRPWEEKTGGGGWRQTNSSSGTTLLTIFEAGWNPVRNNSPFGWVGVEQIKSLKVPICWGWGRHNHVSGELNFGFVVLLLCNLVGLFQSEWVDGVKTDGVSTRWGVESLIKKNVGGVNKGRGTRWVGRVCWQAGP